MPNSSKQKGSRVEREIAQELTQMGIPSKRVPLSGAAGRFSQMLEADLSIFPESRDMRGEVKARRNGEGFAVLERWLGENDLLFLKRDRQDPMVVLPWPVFLEVMLTYARHLGHTQECGEAG